METLNCRQRHRKVTFHGKVSVTLELVEDITYVVHMLHLLTGDVCSIRKGERGIRCKSRHVTQPDFEETNLD